MVRLNLFVVLMLAGVLCLAACSTAEEKGKPANPFNGKNLDGWKTKNPKERSKWTVGKSALNENDPAKVAVSEVGEGTAELINSAGGGVDIYTEEKYGDCTIEVELMVPKGSNSGIYVMGEYEIQILDSFGKEKVGPGDLGGLYGASAPKLNAAKKPGEWQKFVIDFQAPRFDGDKKTANAKFVKVVLNGEVIHENVEMKGPTPSGVTGKESASGPLMFQGDHGPVAFRNIKITPRGEK